MHLVMSAWSIESRGRGAALGIPTWHVAHEAEEPIATQARRALETLADAENTLYIRVKYAMAPRSSHKKGTYMGDVLPGPQVFIATGANLSESERESLVFPGYIIIA